MADNLTTPIPDTTKMATKDLAGVHIPKSTIVDQAGNDPIGQPVASPSTYTLLGWLKAIKDAISGTLTVGLPTGAATSAKQDAIVAAIGGATYYPVTQPVSGTVSVSGTVPVSGTFYPTTQPVSASSLPLPTGAATGAKQDAIIDAIEAAEFYPATQPVSAASLPLPSGAATSAKQDAVKESIDAAALVAVPFTIAPHATSALARPIKAIGIVTGGTVVFRAPDGTEDETLTLGPGLWPLPATHIRDTSTAEGLTGF